jgi:hypothetical protein
MVVVANCFDAVPDVCVDLSSMELNALICLNCHVEVVESLARLRSTSGQPAKPCTGLRDVPQPGSQAPVIREMVAPLSILLTNTEYHQVSRLNFSRGSCKIPT